MVAKSIAKMYTNIHKPTDYCRNFAISHLSKGVIHDSPI